MRSERRIRKHRPDRHAPQCCEQMTSLTAKLAPPSPPFFHAPNSTPTLPYPSPYT
jgi:hypothetical protein